MKDFEKILLISEALDYEGDTKPLNKKNPAYYPQHDVIDREKQRNLSQAYAKEQTKEPVQPEKPIDDKLIMSVLTKGSKQAALQTMKDETTRGFTDLTTRLKNSRAEVSRSAASVRQGLEKLKHRMNVNFNLKQALPEDRFSEISPLIMNNKDRFNGSPKLVGFAAKGGDGSTFTIIKNKDLVQESLHRTVISEGIVYEGNIAEYKKKFLYSFFNMYQMFFNWLRKEVSSDIEYARNEGGKNKIYAGVMSFAAEYLLGGFSNFPQEELNDNLLQTYLTQFHITPRQYASFGLVANPLDLNFFYSDYFNKDNMSIMIGKDIVLVKDMASKYPTINFLDEELLNAMAEFLNLKLFFINAQHIMDLFTEGKEVGIDRGLKKQQEGMIEFITNQVEALAVLLVPSIFYGLDDNANGAVKVVILHNQDFIFGVSEQLWNEIGGVADKVDSGITAGEQNVMKLYKLTNVILMSEEKFSRSKGLYVLESVFRSISNMMEDRSMLPLIQKLGLAEEFTIYSKILKQVEQATEFPNNEDYKDIILADEKFSKLQFEQVPSEARFVVLVGWENCVKFANKLLDTFKKIAASETFVAAAKGIESKVAGKTSSRITQIKPQRVNIATPESFIEQLNSLAKNKLRLYLENKDKKILQDLMKKIVEKKKIEILQ